MARGITSTIRRLQQRHNNLIVTTTSASVRTVPVAASASAKTVSFGTTPGGGRGRAFYVLRAHSSAESISRRLRQRPEMSVGIRSVIMATTMPHRMSCNQHSKHQPRFFLSGQRQHCHHPQSSLGCVNVRRVGGGGEMHTHHRQRAFAATRRLSVASASSSEYFSSTSTTTESPSATTVTDSVSPANDNGSSGSPSSGGVKKESNSNNKSKYNSDRFLKWRPPTDPRRKVYCNRSLNMKSIQAVGFDMDYTLAQYKSEEFEKLAYDETLKKLVRMLGYPDELLSWEYDETYMVRGLAVDKARGNILKIDRHKYVKVAYHGFRELSHDERHDMYHKSAQRETFSEPKYALIDTLFSLSEAYLYTQLVEFKAGNPEKLSDKSFEEMYHDVRGAVDLCHRDGSLKQAVANDPGKYVHPDASLMPLFEQLRSSGRKVFILTNSLFDFTDVVMRFLCDDDPNWIDRFDLVFTGSCKPAFFTQERPSPLFEVHTGTGLLRNTDNGSPMAQIGDIEKAAAKVAAASKSIQNGANGDSGIKVAQGGGYQHLHDILGIKSGSEVLYVGDHIYGDILRSKKDLGWRTCLIVPELVKELEVGSKLKGREEYFQDLRERRDELDDELLRLSWAMDAIQEISSNSDGDSGSAGIHLVDFGDVDADIEGEGSSQYPSMEELQVEYDKLVNERDSVRDEHRINLREHHRKFHPVWGQLLKTGYQSSRFAHQIERFACIYCAHVSCLSHYSPERSFRGRPDYLPHESEYFENHSLPM